MIIEMSDEMNRQILEELKKIDQKLDKLGERRSLSTPMKFIALFLGFAIIGPFLMSLLPFITKIFS